MEVILLKNVGEDGAICKFSKKDLSTFTLAV